MSGKFQLGVTSHAVERYRDRVESDMWRHLRPESQIARILRENIEPSLASLEDRGMPLDGRGKIAVGLIWDGRDFGDYEVALIRVRSKGRKYFQVVTIYRGEEEEF